MTSAIVASAAHTHDWVYSRGNDNTTLYALCPNTDGDCDLLDQITVVAPLTNTFYLGDDYNVYEILPETLNDEDSYNSVKEYFLGKTQKATGLHFEQYWATDRAGSTDHVGARYTEKPDAVGNYVAEVSVVVDGYIEGQISIPYSIKYKAVTPTRDIFVSFDGGANWKIYTDNMQAEYSGSAITPQVKIFDYSAYTTSTEADAALFAISSAANSSGLIADSDLTGNGIFIAAANYEVTADSKTAVGTNYPISITLKGAYSESAAASDTDVDLVWDIHKDPDATPVVSQKTDAIIFDGSAIVADDFYSFVAGTAYNGTGINYSVQKYKATWNKGTETWDKEVDTTDPATGDVTYKTDGSAKTSLPTNAGIYDITVIVPKTNTSADGDDNLNFKLENVVIKPATITVTPDAVTGDLTYGLVTDTGVYASTLATSVTAYDFTLTGALNSETVKWKKDTTLTDPKLVALNGDGTSVTAGVLNVGTYKLGIKPVEDAELTVYESDGATLNTNYVAAFADTPVNFTVTAKELTYTMLANEMGITLNNASDGQANEDWTDSGNPAELYPSLAYTGRERTFTVTLEDKLNNDTAKAAIASTNYDVEGNKQTDRNTTTDLASTTPAYTATITGKGNYTGTLTFKWRILTNSAATPAEIEFKITGVEVGERENLAQSSTSNTKFIVSYNTSDNIEVSDITLYYTTDKNMTQLTSGAFDKDKTLAKVKKEADALIAGTGSLFNRTVSIDLTTPLATPAAGFTASYEAQISKTLGIASRDIYAVAKMTYTDDQCGMTDTNGKTIGEKTLYTFKAWDSSDNDYVLVYDAAKIGTYYGSTIDDEDEVKTQGYFYAVNYEEAIETKLGGVTAALNSAVPTLALSTTEVAVPLKVSNVPPDINVTSYGLKYIIVDNTKTADTTTYNIAKLEADGTPVPAVDGNTALTGTATIDVNAHVGKNYVLYVLPYYVFNGRNYYSATVTDAVCNIDSALATTVAFDTAPATLSGDGTATLNFNLKVTGAATVTDIGIYYDVENEQKAEAVMQGYISGNGIGDDRIWTKQPAFTSYDATEKTVTIPVTGVAHNKYVYAVAYIAYTNGNGETAYAFSYNIDETTLKTTVGASTNIGVNATSAANCLEANYDDLAAAQLAASTVSIAATAGTSGTTPKFDVKVRRDIGEEFTVLSHGLIYNRVSGTTLDAAAMRLIDTATFGADPELVAGTDTAAFILKVKNDTPENSDWYQIGIKQTTGEKLYAIGYVIVQNKVTGEKNIIYTSSLVTATYPAA